MLCTIASIARLGIRGNGLLYRVSNLPWPYGKYLVWVTANNIANIAKVGFVFAPYAGVLYFLTLLIVSVVPATIVLPLAVVVHLVCWAAQVFGHVGCESNRPAMFTSLVHSVLAAPVVVYLETLFSFGLLSETQERLDDARGLTLENATTTVTATTTTTTEPVTTIYGTAQA